MIEIIVIGLVQLFFLMGIIFSIMGNLGVLIFPDIYTRLQASSTCSTTSVFSIFLAAMMLSGFSVLSGKILVITIFFLISSPVSSYIIAQYAWNKEIVPWRKIRHRRSLEQEERQ